MDLIDVDKTLSSFRALKIIEINGKKSVDKVDWSDRFFIVRNPMLNSIMRNNKYINVITDMPVKINCIYFLPENSDLASTRCKHLEGEQQTNNQSEHACLHG